MRRNFGIDNSLPLGPIVSGVVAHGPAGRAGLMTGDVVLDVNKTRVSSARSAIQSLQKGGNILRVARGGRILVIIIRI